MTWSVLEFARQAGVTVKALHHYDRLGLLRPQRTEAGYRVYGNADLERLEQIVALKYLGLPLKQIRILLEREELDLSDALRLQRTVLEEKRRRIDSAIASIGYAESVLQSGKPASAAALRKIIEAIQMQTETLDANEFMKNYYRPDVWPRVRPRFRDWPSRAWNDLFRDIESALDEDPAGPRAQALAARWKELWLSDAGGDPQVCAGLLKAWNDRKYWPDAVQSRFAAFPLDRISPFIAAAFAAHRRTRYGEIVWEKELDCFTPQEREGPTLAAVDLYFKIGAVCHQDPRSDTAQALAARWLELIASRTGAHAGSRDQYESYLRWMNAWPAAIHQKIQALDQEKIGAFILEAIAA